MSYILVLKSVVAKRWQKTSPLAYMAGTLGYSQRDSVQGGLRDQCVTLLSREVCKPFGGRNKTFDQADALPGISRLEIFSQSFLVAQ